MMQNEMGFMANINDKDWLYVNVCDSIKIPHFHYIYNGDPYYIRLDRPDYCEHPHSTGILSKDGKDKLMKFLSSKEEGKSLYNLEHIRQMWNRFNMNECDDECTIDWYINELPFRAKT